MEYKSKGSILIVDDAPDNLELMKDILANHGYEVFTAKSGPEAVSMIHNSTPDLILLDVMMPDMNGFEVCKMLKSDDTTREIPIIFLSALNKVSDKISGLKAGGVDYITKPFQQKEVLTRVEIHLKTSRVRAQLELLKIRQEAILDAVPNIIMEVNDHKIYTWANSSGLEFFGADVIGKEAAYYFEGEQETYDKVRPLFNGAEGIFYVESWQRRRDGEKRLLGWWCHVLKDKSGRVTGALSSAQDITERFRIEQDLKESERKFRNVFENSSVGKSLTTLDGKVNVNKAFCKMTGYTEKELSRMKWQDLTHPEDVDKDQKMIDSILEGEKDSGRWEKRYVHKNGKVVWADISTVLQRDQNGKPLYFITSVIEITERKQLNESLRESLERFQLATKATFNVIWDWDLQSDALSWNENFRILFGYDEDETEPGIESWTNRIHPDDLDRSVAGIHEAIDTRKEFWRDQYRFRRKDGKYAVIEDRGYISYEESGKPLRMIGAMEDITERVRSEEALRMVNENLEKLVKERTLELQRVNAYNRGLIEASMDPLVTIGPDGKVTDVNTATEHVTGRKREEIIGTDFSNYFTESDKARSGYQKVFADGFVRDYELFIRHQDGHVTPVHYNATVYKDESGQVIGIFAAARDMTEIKEAEIKLKRSKQLLDETGRLARVGGWELDLRTNLLVWTDMVYEIHEIERDFMPTLDSGISFYAPESLPAISEAVRLAIEEGKPFDLELQIITAKKNRIWVRAVGEAYREKGKTVKIGGVFQDINDRKLAENELQRYRFHLEEIVAKRTNELATAVQNLERSNLDLEQFAYVASHDLQEPLRMVSSYTQLLERRYKDRLDQDANDFIQFAVDGANRMQKLINDLLDYSRITTRGKSFKETDFCEILGQALSNLQQLISETTALVSNDDLPETRADETQILRLFQNLIENAIKFRKATELPRIHISCLEKEDCHEFSVRDNGIGIEQKYHDKVFVIFQRLQSKADFPGTGIGLAICKRIVERHGGKIWFDSKENEGTTFYFTIKKNGGDKNGKN